MSDYESAPVSRRGLFGALTGLASRVYLAFTGANDSSANNYGPRVSRRTAMRAGVKAGVAVAAAPLLVPLSERIAQAYPDEPPRNPDQARSRMEGGDYGESIGVAANRISYFIRRQNDNSPIGQEVQQFRALLQNYDFMHASRAGIMPSESFSRLQAQNDLLHQLFQNNRINYWVIESINNNVDCDDDFELVLNESDRTVLNDALRQLALPNSFLTNRERQALNQSRIELEQLAANNRNTPAQYDSERISRALTAELNYNEHCLQWLRRLATARGNIEVLEGNIPRMHTSYWLAAKITESITGRDEYFEGRDLLSDHGTDSIGDLHLEDLASRVEFEANGRTINNGTLNQFYAHLMERIEQTLREGWSPNYGPNYGRVNTAFQHLIPAVYSIPIHLQMHGNITAEQAVALKKVITQDLSRIFLGNDGADDDFPPTSNLGDYAQSLVPLWNIKYLIELPDLFTADDFEPDSETIEGRFQETLRAANRLSSGESANHFVGNNAGYVTIPISALTTGATIAAVTTFVQGELDNDDRITPPTPPVPIPDPGPDPVPPQPPFG